MTTDDITEAIRVIEIETEKQIASINISNRGTIKSFTFFKKP